jgi:hypothetical protein
MSELTDTGAADGVGDEVAFALGETRTSLEAAGADVGPHAAAEDSVSKTPAKASRRTALFNASP